jgi:hypothetical protein
MGKIKIQTADGSQQPPHPVPPHPVDFVDTPLHHVERGARDLWSWRGEAAVNAFGALLLRLAHVCACHAPACCGCFAQRNQTAKYKTATNRPVRLVRTPRLNQGGENNSQ